MDGDKIAAPLEIKRRSNDTKQRNIRPTPLRAVPAQPLHCRALVDDVIGATQRMVSVARPAVIAHPPDQTCAYRIQFDVAEHGQHVLVTFENNGARPVHDDLPASPLAPIDGNCEPAVHSPRKTLPMTS